MNTVYKTQLFCLFFTYESQPSVPPVEQKQKHLETDALTESRWQPYKNISSRKQRNYSELLQMTSSKSIGFSLALAQLGMPQLSLKKRSRKFTLFIAAAMFLCWSTTEFGKRVCLQTLPFVFDVKLA